MDHRRQGQPHRPPPPCPPVPRRGEKKTPPLLDHWEALWDRYGNGAATSRSCARRYRDHLLAQLVCPGRRTVTSLITAHGAQFGDWTAHYDLYAERRVKPEVLFQGIREEIEALNGPSVPLTVALDDTLLRKTGKLIPGAAYRRDPLGPPFNVNLVWAQRMIQCSAALLDATGEARMVPIGLIDASTPRKPRQNQAPEAWDAYREAMRQMNLNHRALGAIRQLQAQRQGRPLRVVVDGSYTNQTMLRNLPENTVLIGRIRKDARLHAAPESQPEKGRRRVYGGVLPTPEALRQDENLPWRKVEVVLGGKTRSLEVKTMDRVRWRKAGGMDIKLVVIRPVPYTGPGGLRQYRQPAYLICTDPALAEKEILQGYVGRWDIELNHRDEKTLLGVGQAQVRNPHSAWAIPASAVAAYAMLHLAAAKAYGWSAKPNVIPQPKWRTGGGKHRASTQDLINELRRELWADAIHRSHLCRFMQARPHDSKREKCHPNIASCLFAAIA